VVGGNSRSKVSGRTLNFSFRAFWAISSINTLSVNISLITGTEVASRTVVRLRAHGSTVSRRRASVRLASAVRTHITSFTRLRVSRCRRTESTFSAIPALFITASRIIRNPR